MLGAVVCMLVFCTDALAQKKGGGDQPEITTPIGAAEQSILDDAEYFFENDNYLRALPLYLKLIDKYPNEPFYRYRAGICYLYKTDEKEKAIEMLDKVETQNPKLPDLNYYLGRAYHINYKFEQAVSYFNAYIKENPPAKKKEIASHYIDYCNNAPAVMSNKVKVEIKNLGPSVNTKESEYAPVISADESVLIYTYKGERSTGGLQDLKFRPDPNGDYYEDVFISYKVGSNFQNGEPIGNNINTKQHDACIALSPDGQTLFIYKSDPKHATGDIYVSNLKGQTWGVPKKLNENINTKYWEGSCSLSADGNSLYFASERPGGFGGRDIYVSHRQKNGDWGKAENLGPNINTPYNDDAPFIHPDGITLFFSSEGHNSMGGYDIMYSTLKDGVWSEPNNIGYPVNTTEDDIYYVLSANGETGYYASARKGSYGQLDIYQVTPGVTGQKPILALVVGVVTANDKPVDAKITVTNQETGQKTVESESNSATGKYIIALTPGNNYKIAFDVEGMNEHIEYVNVKSLDTYVQVQQDIKLYSDDYKKKKGIAIADSSNALQNNIDKQIEKYKEALRPEVCQAKVYQKILKTKGDKQNEGVSYYVEVGTFENPADFNPSKIKDLGAISNAKDDNGNTQFYFDNTFNTLLDAEIFKYKVLKEDTSFSNTILVKVTDHGKKTRVQDYYADDYDKEGCNKATASKIIKARKGIIGLSNDSAYQKLVRDSGNKSIEGLTFKVEIGAVRDTNEFKLGYLSKYGKIERKLYPDGIYRYSFGPFKTLREAEDFRKMLVEKEAEASQSFVTVFVFGQRKTIDEHYHKKDTIPPPGPCDPNSDKLDFSWFAGKDLNNKEVYSKLINMAGNFCKEGLIFKVQIAAYRHPENYKYPYLKKFEPPPAEVLPFPDGITRFTMREFRTLKEAEAFRQQVITAGQRDAWITAVYKGQRTYLTELIKVNFYNAKIN